MESGKNRAGGKIIKEISINTDLYMFSFFCSAIFLLMEKIINVRRCLGCGVILNEDTVSDKNDCYCIYCWV